MKDIIKVACIQMDCEIGNVKANLEKARSLLIKAKENGAEFAVLPELFNVGYQLDILNSLDYDFCDTAQELSNISQELNIYIAAGVFEKYEGKYYNSTVVYNNKGELIEKYRKINLFCLSNEKEVFEAGNEIKVFNIGSFKFGILICYDIRFPELSRRYLNEGCSALIVSSAFPFPRLEHWNTLLKARAIENQSYVIASNRSGRDGDMRFLGNSYIIDPWGSILANASDSEDTVLVHDIDIKEVDRVRTHIPCIKDKAWLEAVLK